MEKIIGLFKRDYEGTRQIFNEIVPGAEWVIAGEGVATVKWDGTCCMVRDGKLYKRYDAKGGKQPPPDFEPAQDADPQTGHWPGWVPVGEGPEDKYHRAAWGNMPEGLTDGTYELLGPKVQGNPYELEDYILAKHGAVVAAGVPRDFEGLRIYFMQNRGIEGIVWHHKDGRMVKVKRKDFGYAWPTRLVERDGQLTEVAYSP